MEPRGLEPLPLLAKGRHHRRPRAFYAWWSISGRWWTHWGVSPLLYFAAVLPTLAFRRARSAPLCAKVAANDPRVVQGGSRHAHRYQ